MTEEIILLIFSLVLSAFFSSSEIGFIAANQIKFEIYRRKDKTKHNSVYYFISRPERFLTTILIGNNVSNILFSSLAAVFLVNYFPNSVIIVISSLILMVFGESIPKAMVSLAPNSYIKFSAIPLRLFEYLFYPLNIIVKGSTEILLKILGTAEPEVNNFFSKKDLEIIMRVAHERGLVGKASHSIFSKIIALDKLIIRSILVPRTEIVAIPKSSSINDALKIFTTSGFSRLPVYQDEIDNIVGIINVLDFLIPPENIDEIMSEPFFVPSTRRAVKVLRQMQTKRISMAIVLDEYGGTAGLITIEDLIEEIIGDIFDEFDVVKRMIREDADGSYIINGRAEVVKLNEKFNLNLPLGDYTTIGGLLEEKMGKIPVKGEIANFEDCKIKVTRASPRKVIMVKLIPCNDE